MADVVVSLWPSCSLFEAVIVEPRTYRRFDLAITHWSRPTSYSPPDLGDCSWAGIYTISVCNQPPRSTQPSIPPGYNRLLLPQTGGWLPPVKTCIANCGQTVPDTRVVYIDSQWELTSSQGRLTKYQSFWLGLVKARSLVSGGSGR